MGYYEGIGKRTAPMGLLDECSCPGCRRVTGGAYCASSPSSSVTEALLSDTDYRRPHRREGGSMHTGFWTGPNPILLQSTLLGEKETILVRFFFCTPRSKGLA